ncbi:MAG: helix-turn-helix domain-containing protein [Paraclostridium sp.]
MEYKNTKRTIGDNLKEIIGNKNINARELAKLTRLDPSYIYELLRNKRNNPSIKVLIKISKALDISILSLIRDVDF